jgi:hypothetical protein
VSQEKQPSFKEVHCAIWAIINGQPVPEYLAEKQEHANKEIRRKLASLLFIRAPLLIIAAALIALYALPAIAKYLS